MKKNITRETILDLINNNLESTIDEANKLNTKHNGVSKTTTIGFRLPNLLHYLLKPKSGEDYDYPIKEILSCGLVYFMKLSDEDKIKYLYENSIDTVKVKELKTIENGFNYYTNDLLKNILPQEVLDKLTPEERLKTVIHMFNQEQNTKQ